MSFITGNTQFTSSGFRVPQFTSAGRPTSPVVGQVIYNTSTGQMEIYAGDNWQMVVNERSFFYRQVITSGYVLGGYKDYVVWRNVNKMAHATDVMSNLGDQIDVGAAYTSGACSLRYGYLWACTSAWPGTTALTSAFNLATETTGGASSNWNMRNSRDDCGTIFKEHQYAYILGGGTGDIDVFNLTTEVMLATDVGADSIAGTSFNYGVGTLSDENCGYAWSDINTKSKLSFSTMTNYIVQAGIAWGGEAGQQKGINSKLAKGWCGRDGSYSGGYILNRWDFVTETLLGTVAKPVTNSGEENFDMGQFHQYMYGCYDGAQNNRGWKFTYATDSGVELGSGSIRTGVAGGSSGHCVWKG